MKYDIGTAGILNVILDMLSCSVITWATNMNAEVNNFHTLLLTVFLDMEA
jgi:hypothetical protein